MKILYNVIIVICIVICCGFQTSLVIFISKDFSPPCGGVCVMVVLGLEA